MTDIYGVCHVGDFSDPTAMQCCGGEILLEQVRRHGMMIV